MKKESFFKKNLDLIFVLGIGTLFANLMVFITILYI